MPNSCWKSLPPKDKAKYPGLQMGLVGAWVPRKPRACYKVYEWVDRYFWKWASLVIIISLIISLKVVRHVKKIMRYMIKR